jgi:hypothetical protein
VSRWLDATAELWLHVRAGFRWPAGRLRVRNAFEQLLVAQPLQPVGEYVGGDPELRLELLEARQADDGVADDQQRPALTNDLE